MAYEILQGIAILVTGNYVLGLRNLRLRGVWGWGLVPHILLSRLLVDRLLISGIRSVHLERGKVVLADTGGQRLRRKDGGRYFRDLLTLGAFSRDLQRAAHVFNLNGKRGVRKVYLCQFFVKGSIF